MSHATARRLRFVDGKLGACAAVMAALLWSVLMDGSEVPGSLDSNSELSVPVVTRIRGAEPTVRVSKASYSPAQVEGPPDIRQPGDNGLAWASQSQDEQREWLLCEYAVPMQIRAVMVYETYNPGALTRVTAFNAEGDEVVAWEGEDPTPAGKPRGVSVIPVKLDFAVQRIRLTIDSPAVPGWNEIDAVGVADAEGNTHWASRVEASSTYGTQRGSAPRANSKRSYAPEQAAGEPDTPGPGDQGSAWAPATPDNQPEWLVCEFKTPQVAAEVVVHENNAPGAITKLTVFKPDGKEVTVWEGIDPTPRDQPWGISVFPVKVDFPFQKLKLSINSKEVPGYNEIDAVGLRAANGDIEWASGVEASSTYGSPVMESGMTQSGMSNDRQLKSLQSEVQTLRRQVEELQQGLRELKELKESLKDKPK
ncbi:MAG: hypothetical protein IAG10_06385 [Planctomycetaceae bacterium]|nr:hypothetical protein [Planctomycetaceae bacterium]